jgi:hypothetical protein
MMNQHPYRSRFVIALCAAGFSAGTLADTATSAEIEDLKARIKALEQKQQTPAVAPAAAPATSGDFKLGWGGYVKLDTNLSRFSDGPVSQGTGRDFYSPGAIPVAAASAANGRGYTDFLAKETRLFLKGDGEILGHKTGAYVEFDFISGQLPQAATGVSGTGLTLGSSGSANEAVTNAYNPALRRAFITFDSWEFGQDWSNFQNLVALPETLDFVAWPSDGTVFNRQPQLRYTVGGLSVSIENPETTVAANKAAAFANTDDNTVPDFSAKYDFKTGIGEYTVAGLVRQISDRGAVGGANDVTIGYGGSIAGKIPVVGRDDIRFTISGGDGIGRYLALNTIGDAVVDAGGRLHTIEVVNGFVAYHHVWTEQWRSNLTLSAYHANVGKGTSSDLGGGATRNIRSASINLLYSPIPKLTLGGEFRYARRDTVGDNSGDLKRLQLSAKYAF